MKLTFEIEDGYVGGYRPHDFTIDMSVLEDWDFENDSFEDFLADIVEPWMQEEFDKFYPMLTDDSLKKLEKEYNKVNRKFKG